MASVILYLCNMNLVILLWTKDTTMSKLDRHLRPVEKHVLPLLMANAVGWLYCLPFYYVARRMGPLDGWDIAAVIVYFVGTIVHVAADWQKKPLRQDLKQRGACWIEASGATADIQLLWRYPRIC